MKNWLYQNVPVLRGMIARTVPNPAAQWPAEAATSIVVDVPAGSVSGVRIGDSLDELTRFGRPSNRHPVLETACRWHALGLMIGLRPDVLTVDEFSVGIGIGEEWDLTPRRETLAVVGRGGAIVEVTSATTRDELERLLGPPTKVDHDEDEVVLSYRFEGHEVVFEIDHEAGLFYVGCYVPAA